MPTINIKPVSIRLVAVSVQSCLSIFIRQDADKSIQLEMEVEHAGGEGATHSGTFTRAQFGPIIDAL